MNKINSSTDSLDSLVLLRGIAVLMVCFCHFGKALSKGHLFAPLFDSFHEYGKYGVHIFFVISGFVIPFSLFKGRYSIVDYPLFLYKRFLRLHPPYLAALALTLVIMYLSFKVRHVVYPENLTTIFQSIFYLHTPADNPVFWTLMVEAQYYIFIGLFYVLLIQYPKVTLLVVIPILLIISQTYISEYISLFQYIVFFLIGTVGFLIYTKKSNYIFNIIVLVSLFVFIAFYYSIPALISSFLAIIIILSFKKKVLPLIKFPGLISYSIYLIHFPIGIKLINYFRPKIDPAYSWLLFLVVLILIVTISWVFYKIFESYSEKLSKQIRYKASEIRESDISVNEVIKVGS
jgi:peptidoglycan/LPS O-acetylase OafA/YrhL